MKKFLIIISVVFLSVFAFFFGNIKGYYHFKQYCELEGGLKVYEPLTKNFGWLAEDKGLAESAAMLSGVSFARYSDKYDNASYDIRYLGGDIRNDSSYKIEPASSELDISYLLKSETYYLDENKRLKKIEYSIFNSLNSKVAVYRNFFYSKQSGALGGPDWISCSSYIKNFDWKNSLENSFKN